MSLGKQFLDAVIAAKDVMAFLSEGEVDHLFRGTEVAPFEFVRDFVRQYGAFPTPATVKAHTGEDLVKAPEPPQYYRELLQSRYVEHSVKAGVQEALKLLEPAHKDPESSLEALREMVGRVTTRRYGPQLHDFRKASDVVIPAYAAKIQGHADRLMLGWTYLDELTGGIGKGDMVSLIGKSGIGKTYLMLYAAWFGWHQAEEHNALCLAENRPEDMIGGGRRFFWSGEVGVVPLEERLAAMQTQVPVWPLKHAKLTTASLKKLKNGLVEVQGYGEPFWVMDGNAATTVDEATALVRTLRPDAAFFDGAYLMKNPREKDRYRRVAENVEQIKQEICPLCPAVCSWQFAKGKKDAKGKKQKQDASDIGNSVAIEQTSSILLGLFEDENVETIQRRVIELLKGRDGETGSWMTNWNFQKMDFSQYVEPEVADLQFV